jgi:hypothetical protein
MANILSADDATFAATVGNWVASGTGNTLTRQTAPTSPDGTNVGQIQKTSGSNQFVVAQIGRAIHPVATGDKVSMELAYNVPVISGGTGTLFCQISVQIYETNPAAGGVTPALATSAPFTEGTGWRQLSVAEFTVGTVSGAPAAWVGCTVTFGPWTGTGFLNGDVAYFSDVLLGVPVVGGGWGVGMVRMGAN